MAPTRRSLPAATTTAAKTAAAKSAAAKSAAAKAAVARKAAAKAAVARKAEAKAPRARPAWTRAARPDAIDFRDRWFMPSIGQAPAPARFPEFALPIKDQGTTNACTGFALSLVVEHLLRRHQRESDPSISPYMLYSMARRYDEFPGSVADEGSSLRGALKGWFKHGACRRDLFAALEMPKAAQSVADDWWFDAVRRPLGAYYRIAPTNLIDMHAALNEVGILLASCGCHSGWDEGMTGKPVAPRPASFDDGIWTIPVRSGSAEHAGHAFAIVGYNARGFVIQNSWGPEWGTHGLALLTYDDWLDNAMDCWVAQLGVVTEDHRILSTAETLRTGRGGKVVLASSDVLRNREIAPFVLNMGNNGKLSQSGEFRTRPDDVRAIASVQLERARTAWGLKDAPVDVCVYAHGGLVGEKDAAATAARWVPRLYEQKIFPVFLMWETDFVSTLGGLIADSVAGVPRTTGAGGAFERWWNQRLERVLSGPGTALWGEMKQNADAISRYLPGEKNDDLQAGAVLLYRHFKHQVENKNVRMHFVGHSAGAIVGAWMLARLAEEGMAFESVSFMAPAVRCDVFEATVAPLLAKGGIRRYQQFSLTERAEEDDPSCGPYRRSLLHLVAEAFEGGKRTPILGLERDARALLKTLPQSTVHWAPGPRSAATTHGGFDDDDLTMAQVLRFIRQA